MSTKKKSVGKRGVAAAKKSSRPWSAADITPRRAAWANQVRQSAEAAGAQAPSIEPHTPAIPIVPAIPCDRCGTLHHLGAPTYATLGAVMIGEDGAAVTERVMRVCLGWCIFAHLDQMREALGAHAQQYPEQKIVDTVLPGPAAKVGGMVPNAKSAYPIVGVGVGSKSKEAFMDENTPTIFITDCPIKKSGFHAVGQFGARMSEVVIMERSTWQKLCAEIPELGAMEFRVETEV